MGGDHFPFIQWTFSILTINIETPQNLKNIEQNALWNKNPYVWFNNLLFWVLRKF